MLLVGFAVHAMSVPVIQVLGGPVKNWQYMDCNRPAVAYLFFLI